MIPLRRIDGREFWLNEDLVLTIEELPDTLLTLTNGDRLRVHESIEEVLERIVAFRRRIRCGAPGASFDAGAAKG